MSVVRAKVTDSLIFLLLSGFNVSNMFNSSKTLLKKLAASDKGLRCMSGKWSVDS